MARRREYVRKNICEDFVNYDHHYHCKIVPRKEFWIAKESKHDEIRYYIDRMLAEYRMVKAGASYAKASLSGEIIERGERSKSDIMRRLGRKRMHRKRILDMVRIKMLKMHKIRGSRLEVWLVNGELVRDLLFINFSGGGHDKVYHSFRRTKYGSTTT